MPFGNKSSCSSIKIFRGVYKGKTIYYIIPCRDCLPYCYDSFATKVVGLTSCDFDHMGFFICPKGFTKRKPYAILKNMKSLWTEQYSKKIQNLFIKHMTGIPSIKYTLNRQKRKPEK